MAHIVPSTTRRSRSLSVADIKGWPAISYLRFSSGPQEKGDSIDRQQRALARAVREAGLLLDRVLEDRAKSGSKGDNRTKGELGGLLKAIDDGAIPPNTVLIIEALDRLTRESVLDVYPMLGKMVRNGIVLLVCGEREGELELYDEAAIDGPRGDHLHSEIRAAFKYAKRLSQLAEGAHLRRRESAARGEKVVPNGKPPGWIDRVIVPDQAQRSYTHTLNGHAATVVMIFEMCEAGMSTREIAASLNARNVPTMSRKDAQWRGPRIATLLRDDAVIGYYTPIQWIDRERVAVGAPALVYPPAISPTLWHDVQNILSGRPQVLRGAIGRSVPNLFTGHCFCRSCGATLRMDTGGGIRNGRRKKDLICGAYMDAKTCHDRTRYDMHIFEPMLLRVMIELAPLAPKPAQRERPTAERLAALRSRIAQQQAAINALSRSPAASTSATLIHQIASMACEVDEWRREEAALTIEASNERSQTSRWEDNFAMLRKTVGPALHGDIIARDQLRGLLARHDYRVVGDGYGGLQVTLGGQTRTVNPEEDERDRLYADDHAEDLLPA